MQLSWPHWALLVLGLTFVIYTTLFLPLPQNLKLKSCSQLEEDLGNQMILGLRSSLTWRTTCIGKDVRTIH